MKLCKYCDRPVPLHAAACPGCGATEFQFRCDRCGTIFSSPCCPQCGLSGGAEARTCPSCGTKYFSNACPSCGYVRGVSRAAPVRQETVFVREVPVQAVSGKSRLAALLLLLFLGLFGAHRFYVGKFGTGLLYCFTAGLFGIGWFFDLILLCAGTFRDRHGLPVARW